VVQYRLYIPHGSDESPKAVITALAHDLFISHMVQMKDYYTLHQEEDEDDFISHMVQMKASEGPSKVFDPKTFISHMVQMKE